MEEIINKLESIISNIFNITIEELRDNGYGCNNGCGCSASTTVTPA